jgi:GTPase SAR1 family protein
MKPTQSSTRRVSPAATLVERLSRPQRVGVFGHRGVGKTTLLTMLYREGVAGRLSGLRLAAADARTASYLADKVLQLERGEALPATLGETELRFNLYKGPHAIELVVMDYQGEHVALGRHEPIRDFLRECDAVWLCLDVPATSTSPATLTAEQEVEQLVEEYLGAAREEGLTRPTALLLTKADLLPDPRPDAETLEELVRKRLPMTRHALESHHPQHAQFAVSSLGHDLLPSSARPIEDAEGLDPGELAQAYTETPESQPAAAPTGPLAPSGLHGPLDWLADALHLQDEARVRKVWELAPGRHDLLARAVHAFCRRHPASPSAPAFRQRLSAQRRARIRRRALAGAVACVALLLSVWVYDLWGGYRARSFAARHADDPVAVRGQYASYQAWHPTRNLFSSEARQQEAEFVADLDRQVRDHRREEELARLRKRAADPDADPDALWAAFQDFRKEYPDHDLGEAEKELRARVEARWDGERQLRARRAFEELEQAEKSDDLGGLIVRAGQFLADYEGTPYAQEVRLRRKAYLARLDERDFAAARRYSADNPENFQTRKDRYREYLEHHPAGKFADLAKGSLVEIDGAWDRHDFRAVRDLFLEKPGDIEELSALCRRYLAVHPRGEFRDKAMELLRWGERVKSPGEYTVRLVSGDFDHAVAAFFSRGPSMSVEIEVNGVRYGPSNIVKRRYDPPWDYEFPRKVRWKLGDAVRIYVTDHYFWKRSVLTVASADDDDLAMRLLSGEVARGKNRLYFQSDFHLPELPKVEE